MTITDDQIKRFDERYNIEPRCTPFEEYEADFAAMDDSNPDKLAFYSIFVNDIITGFTNGFLRYENIDGAEELIGLLERYLKTQEDIFAEAFLAFLKGQHEKCIAKIIKTYSPNRNQKVTETDFLYSFFGPFKNAFPGFYPAIRKACDNICADELAKMLCERMDDFYAATDPDSMGEVLYPILQKFPDSVVANMLLGYTHYEAKRWGSAIACFEKIEGQTTNALFWDDELWFFKGWSYGKLREHKNAAKCYEKVLELFPDSPNALNNLGYEYYLLKQYKKALTAFKRCLDENRDVKYASNNYVRTLIAMGHASEAKAFIADGKWKVSTEIKRRAEAAAETRMLSVQVNASIEAEETDSEEAIEARKRSSRQNADQFSSEKLLEDELTMRIDAGIPVFGQTLKIYRRHGEYGRQYIIPIGRLDLLAEDEKGDLYIIELKKDSGYDDPYEQTAAYLDWFEKHHRKKEQRIFGIICLNNPGKRLIEKVRKDSRMRLFNYSISYDEVK